MKYKLEYEASCPGLGKSKGEVEFEAENDVEAEKEIESILFRQYSSSQWRHMGSNSSDWKPLQLSRIDHLKSFVTNAGPNVSYGEFKDEKQFLDWVATNHGSNVSAICKARIGQAVAGGQKEISAIVILGDLNRATRRVDLAKNGFRAKFGFA
jgi:hypothetical protein